MKCAPPSHTILCLRRIEKAAHAVGPTGAWPGNRQVRLSGLSEELGADHETLIVVPLAARDFQEERLLGQ